jgi:cell wall-associated NlpC family hydrolase
MKKVLPVLFILLAFLVSCVPGGEYYRDSWRNGWFYNKNERGRIVRTAQRYLGVKYKSGGTSPRGFDCSGYVMYVYEKNGIQLPRSVKSQYKAGKKIGPRQIKPGDLVFFKTLKRKRYSHVGIYVGDNRFIHAPRTGKRVSYAELDNPYWKKRFIGSATFMRRGSM